MADKQTVKVGDRITAKFDDSCNDYRAGNTFYVQEIDEQDGETIVVFTDNVGDKRYRRVSEFTVEHVPVAGATGKPAFKVGDRVRVVTKTGARMPDIGTVGVISDCDEGYLVDVEGVGAFGYDAHDLELIPAPFTIETGKFYRTREGLKVGPIDHNGFGVYGAPEYPGYWYENGLSYSDNTHSPTDLIAEWVDAPASNDNARSSKPAIVALIEDGQPKPSEQPKVHKSEESATDEAERLAVKYPGQKFGVFVLADSRIADVVIRRAA